MFQVNPGITLDQFALAVELEDNYQTDSYDLEYPGLIMTIRLNTVTITVDHHHFNCDHDLEQLTIWLKKRRTQYEMALADFHFKLDERCWIPPSTDLPATVWKWALHFAKH